MRAIYFYTSIIANVKGENTMYELFGKNIFNEVEFLGKFHNQKALLDAYDCYWGMGYKNIKYCQTFVR